MTQMRTSVALLGLLLFPAYTAASGWGSERDRAVLLFMVFWGPLAGIVLLGTSFLYNKQYFRSLWLVVLQLVVAAGLTGVAAKLGHNYRHNSIAAIEVFLPGALLSVAALSPAMYQYWKCRRERH